MCVVTKDGIHSVNSAYQKVQEWKSQEGVEPEPNKSDPQHLETSMGFMHSP